MIRKSLAFVLAGFVLIVGAEAQTPAPGAKGETKTFSMFFEGEGAYLGVETEEITRDNFAKFGLREVRGVAVTKVAEGSPAEKAGIQTGDVIVRFNNDDVTSIRKLTRLIGEVTPDHQVRMTVIRGGGEREITATLGKRAMPRFEEGGMTWNMPNVPSFPRGDFPPMPRMEQLPRLEGLRPGVPGEPLVFTFGSGRRIGIGVTSLTKQLGEHFGVANGVIINEVRADSPAAKAGLKAGDIVVEVDGKEVKSEVDLIRAIAEKKEGDVTLTIVRDSNRQTVRVTPEEAKNGGLFEFENMPNGLIAPDGQMKLTVPATPLPMTEFRFPGRIL